MSRPLPHILKNKTAVPGSKSSAAPCGCHQQQLQDWTSSPLSISQMESKIMMSVISRRLQMSARTQQTDWRLSEESGHLHAREAANRGGGVEGAGCRRVGLAARALAADGLLGALRQLDAVQAQLHNAKHNVSQNSERCGGWRLIWAPSVSHMMMPQASAWHGRT